PPRAVVVWVVAMAIDHRCVTAVTVWKSSFVLAPHHCLRCLLVERRGGIESGMNVDTVLVLVPHLQLFEEAEVGLRHGFEEKLVRQVGAAHVERRACLARGRPDAMSGFDGIAADGRESVHP